jgi:flagellar protein FliO/FliZ
MTSNGFTSLLWFIAIIVMIPAALWLLKRTPMGGAGGQGVMRSVAALPLSTNQRIVTVEVGQGESRRWLVLGVTAQSITTLHTMEPQAESVPRVGVDTVTPGFGQLLNRLRQDRAPTTPGTPQ